MGAVGIDRQVDEDPDSERSDGEQSQQREGPPRQPILEIVIFFCLVGPGNVSSRAGTPTVAWYIEIGYDAWHRREDGFGVGHVFEFAEPAACVGLRRFARDKFSTGDP